MVLYRTMILMSCFNLDKVLFVYKLIQQRVIMKKGIRAGEAPIGIDVIEGKSYYWCTCGKSSKQPFCDGSHTGSEFGPLTYKAEQSKKVFFCTCKQTNDQPLCDGSHNAK